VGPWIHGHLQWRVMTTTETSGKQARGPYAKTAARQQEILDIALEVFAQQGFRGGSLREIAERVGLSQAGVLHHFDSKEALLAAVLQQRDTQNRALFAADLAQHGVLDALRHAVRRDSQSEGLVRLFVTLAAEATDPDHPAHAFFVQRYANLLAMIAAELRAGQLAVDIAADVDPDVSAVVIVALWDGLQVQWLLDDRRSMSPAMESYLTTLEPR
jgi:AcrR family transcriptional regulator